MNAFSSYSDVSIVFSDCLFVDENTRDMHETKLQLTYRLSDKKQDSPYTMYNGRFFIDHRMFYQNYIMNASMVVFRKNSRHPDKAYMNYRYVGDWLFWVGILLNGNTVYIDKQLNLFRQHAGNTTATSFSSGNNYKEMGRLMTDICPQKPSRRRPARPAGRFHFVRTGLFAGLRSARSARICSFFLPLRTKWNHFRINDAHPVAPFY